MTPTLSLDRPSSRSSRVVVEVEAANKKPTDERETGVAQFYGVPIILHTDHCAKKLLPWFDDLIEANEDYFNKYGEPLFTSHMLDLSEETMEENLEICAKYLKKMAAIDCFLEMEIGITGGEVRTHPRHAPSLCSETRQQMLLLV